MSSPAHSHRAKLVCIVYASILFSFLFTPVCFIHPGTNLPWSFVADSKEFVPDLRVVHERDLNFVLKSEIFVHTDGQHWASHLILGCVPVYRTWQPFSQDLLLDSLLLSYIDVRHANFLPPKLTSGEARDIGPCYMIADDLASVREKSAEHVSQSRQAHVPIEEPVDPAPPVEQEATKVEPDTEMVTR